ncbi:MULTISPECIES: Gfo/Idh/MocA family protein [Shouchella]|uniref:Oxidoreductase n=2 Tax=Bacillaceae TaxID=186817 RepID=A0A060LUW3_9BACI|nr:MULTISPECIES: Gfo/Idh/MocA family oxidoreductase [Bacillaceae]AIC93972.1 oxidoreductase [Shouchella lehensis G1]KQL55907.1 dehydrogenase [Alkalicoccobacillus plakortidis]RQW19823.1 gfo/Idh/MocA family oxidoreductase [Bacillus sp. C1-1]
MKVGIIGVGGIATNRHIPALQTIEDVEVYGVYDVNQVRATEVAASFAIPFIANSESELFAQVDAVVICTPNKFHHQSVLQALQAGKHVFCEKPMAITNAEAVEMEKAASEGKNVLQIGYHYRFKKEALAAKKLIQTGEIGDPLVIRVEGMRRRKVPGWGVFINKDLQGGGCLMDYGCHLLDLALWLVDYPEIESVHGQTYELVSRHEDQVNEWGAYDATKIDVEDHATAYITFKNGATMLFETSWAANVPSDKETISISGTTGGLNVFPLAMNKASSGMMSTMNADWIAGESNEGIAQARNFVNACLGREESLVKPNEAQQVTSIIEQIYEASKK